MRSGSAGALPRRVRDEWFARGLFCALGGRKAATLRLLPLAVTREEVDEALSILEDAMRSVKLNGTRTVEPARNGSNANG
jgi:4-aminobutyrate aminotransferase-like enzyme